MVGQEWDVVAEVPLYRDADQAAAPEALPAGSVALSWRGDGNFFATIMPYGPDERAIRIWERKGAELHAMGEHARGLDGVLAWQPNGRHLYAAQHVDGRPTIVLYEANGLQHGGFAVSSSGG